MSLAPLLIESYFKKAKKGQRNEILQNFTAVIEGIKPSFLFDMCAVQAKTLQSLIQEWNDRKNDDDLPLLVLLCIDECHYFIGVRQSMIKSLDQALLNGQVFFIDVSCDLEYPRLIKDVQKDKPDICHMVESVKKEFVVQKDQCFFKFQLEPKWNGCSLFGIVLGFKIIYFHEPGEENCLSMIELRRFNVTKNAVSIVSFSVPNNLLVSNQAMSTCLEEWKAQNIEKYSVGITEELVILPNVIM